MHLRECLFSRPRAGSGVSMTSLRSRLMVDGVRPLVRAAPALAWVTIARVASCMGSPLQILRKRNFYGSVLRACVCSSKVCRTW